MNHLKVRTNGQQLFARTDSGKMQWLNNFAAKLPNYREALELSPATVKECQQDAENFAYMIGDIDAFSSIYPASNSLQKPVA